MKHFEEIEEGLKRQIKSICDSDPYGLSPETLYQNIYFSSGTTESLAKIFEVSPSLIIAIKDGKDE